MDHGRLRELQRARGELAPSTPVQERERLVASRIAGETNEAGLDFEALKRELEEIRESLRDAVPSEPDKDDHDPPKIFGKSRKKDRDR